MVQAESSAAAARNGVKANTAGAPPNYELPWYVGMKRPSDASVSLTTQLLRVEKYRPVFLDDIVGNTETIERLKIIAKDGNMPHVIISGMPGIGKTTSVLCLARQLLGDAYKEAVLELNASDERGGLSVGFAEQVAYIKSVGNRYRRGSQPHQGLCTEEGHITSGSA